LNLKTKILILKGTIMNVSNQEAQASLASANDMMLRTRKAIAVAYSSPLLILWGPLLAAAYVATHFYLRYAAPIFWTMAIVGTLGSFIVWPRIKRNLPVREPAEERLSWRISGLWWSLFLYIFIWLSILWPVNGMQINAFILTAAMFGYIVIGLWFAAYFMVWLGLAVTAATLAGFFLLAQYYCLWMAVTAGGLLLGTGLYLRIRWCNYGRA
jgi:MFS family permease